MADNLLLSETLKAWADITIERWRTKIDRLGIGYTLALENSLKAEVMAESGGNPNMVQFTMLMYGRFVDMGVGNGVPVEEVKLLTTDRRLEGTGDGNRRRAKRWYSRTLYAERERLTEILAQKYGRRAALTIAESLKIEVLGV